MDYINIWLYQCLLFSDAKRLLMARTGVASRGQKFRLLTNHFNVKVARNEGYFFHYSVYNLYLYDGCLSKQFSTSILLLICRCRFILSLLQYFLFILSLLVVIFAECLSWFWGFGWYFAKKKEVICFFL